VILPAGLTDVNPSDNSATDRDTVIPRGAEAFFNQFAAGADEGADGHVKVFEHGGRERLSFIAFEGFRGGVRVASGDVNGDGINDIVVGAGFGAGNGHVKVFDGATGSLLASFFSFENFLGGVSVAVGDVNNDGFGDVIVGSGLGAAHVKVFSLINGTPTLLASFIPFQNFQGGITVAAANVDGVGGDEIIVGSGLGAAHVRIFGLPSGATTFQVPTVLGDIPVIPGYTGGIDVAAGDLDGDGRDELVVSPTGSSSNRVFVLNFAGAANLSSPTVTSFPVDFPGPDRGLRVAVTDADGDLDNDIIVAGGPCRGAKVKAFDGLTFAQIEDITAFEGFNGGVFVG